MATRKGGAAAVKAPRASGKTDRDGSGLAGRMAAFVTEYTKDFNGKQAAIRAGYSAKGAEVTASKLLRHPKVAAALAPKQQQQVAERAEAINRMELSVERTRLEVARLAYFDPRKLYDDDGNLKKITELDDDSAAAIAGMDVLELRGENGVIGVVKKYKFADKNSALDKAAKIDGLYAKDNAQSGDAAARMLAGLVVRFVEPGKA